MADELRGFPLRRVEAYTDGVFAIAATLLVLGLTTSAFGEIDSDEALWAALLSGLPSFGSFLLSFTLLSLLWVIHLEQFRDVARVDGGLIWLNNARLLFIVLIPFSSSLADGYQQYYAGRIALPINFFFAILFGHLAWVWAASRGGRLLNPDSTAEIGEQNVAGWSAVVCGAITGALSPWIGSWAFLAYLFSGPIERLRRGRRRAAAARTSGS